MCSFLRAGAARHGAARMRDGVTNWAARFMPASFSEKEKNILFFVIFNTRRRGLSSRLQKGGALAHSTLANLKINI
jgi:hypothetical protein